MADAVVVAGRGDGGAVDVGTGMRAVVVVGVDVAVVACVDLY